MRGFIHLGAWLGFVCLFIGAPLRATPILVGAIATESGVPITGQEDIVVYNLTGPVQGCSTPGGTPICTAVNFDNVTVTINGTDTLNLGTIAPGMTESFTFGGGTFVDGSITSLSFAAMLSTTSLTDDLSNNYTVDANIFLDNLPVDGSFANITASVSSPATAPEPSYVPVAGLFALGCALVARARFKCSRLNTLD